MVRLDVAKGGRARALYLNLRPQAAGLLHKRAALRWADRSWPLAGHLMAARQLDQRRRPVCAGRILIDINQMPKAVRAEMRALLARPVGGARSRAPNAARGLWGPHRATSVWR